MTAIHAQQYLANQTHNPFAVCSKWNDAYNGTAISALTNATQSHAYILLYKQLKQNQLLKNAKVNAPVIEEKVKEVTDFATTEFTLSGIGSWNSSDTDTFEMSLEDDSLQYLDTVAFDFENGEFSFEDAEFSFDDGEFIFDYEDLLLEPLVAQEKIYEKPTYFDANIQLIKTKFDKEYLKYSNYISSDKEQALIKVKELSKEIANVKFENIVVELSPLNTVKFKIKVDSSKMLIITSPFNPSKDMQDNVFFSLLIDGDIVITEVLNLTSLLDGFNKYVTA